MGEINKTHASHLKALEQRKKFLVENLEKIQALKIKVGVSFVSQSVV